MPHDSALKPFIWSGIALSIPAHWDTGHLDKGYALLEARLRPVLEFRTAAIRGRFSFRRHMERLSGGGRTDRGLTFAARPLPQDWPPFPESAAVQAFQWQGATIGGLGLLHFCHECRRATLLQFYAHGNGPPSEVPSVLASFRDHGLRATPSLVVYDIAATLPNRLPLAAFRFDAGCFALDFGQSGGEEVTLWRLSPAKLLLKRHGNDLGAIARNNGLLPSNAPQIGDPIAPEGMQWRWPAHETSRCLKAFMRRRKPRSENLLRIWHPPRSNRLLAVRAGGLGDLQEFERICDAYGVV